jgi:hypothetical protein
MRRAFPILILLLLFIAGSAAAYEYHMPVNIQPTITPSVLMPGDEAVVAIELGNGAAAYGAGGSARTPRSEHTSWISMSREATT